MAAGREHGRQERLHFDILFSTSGAIWDTAIEKLEHHLYQVFLTAILLYYIKSTPPP